MYGTPTTLLTSYKEDKCLCIIFIITWYTYHVELCKNISIVNILGYCMICYSMTCLQKQVKFYSVQVQCRGCTDLTFANGIGTELALQKMFEFCQ